jgi:molybdate transport system substrate-binding protein
VKRRAFISLLGGAVAWPLAARAQQAKVFRIGALVLTDEDGRAFAKELREGLREFGYREGQNYSLELRSADGKGDQSQDREGARPRNSVIGARSRRRGDRIAEFISWEGCMIQTSLAKRIALIAAGGLMSCLFAAVASGAAEIKVLTSVALTSAFNELAPNFEQATGNKLNIGYSLTADIRKRILDGETADVIILSRPVMDELDKQQKFASGSVTNVAGTPVALAIRAGAPKPDISTVDTLKRTLLAAKSIVYADPAKGGVSGVYFAKVVDRLGIADQLKSKTILVPGAQAAEVVAKGEGEIGVAQTSEIVPIAGAEVLGPLPGEFASTTVWTAGIGTTTKVPEAAKSFIQFLTGPVARPVFRAKGFQPG